MANVAAVSSSLGPRGRLGRSLRLRGWGAGPQAAPLSQKGRGAVLGCAAFAVCARPRAARRVGAGRFNLLAALCASTNGNRREPRGGRAACGALGDVARVVMAAARARSHRARGSACCSFLAEGQSGSGKVIGPGPVARGAACAHAPGCRAGGAENAAPAPQPARVAVVHAQATCQGRGAATFCGGASGRAPAARCGDRYRRQCEGARRAGVAGAQLLGVKRRPPGGAGPQSCESDRNKRAGSPGRKQPLAAQSC